MALIPPSHSPTLASSQLMPSTLMDGTDAAFAAQFPSTQPTANGKKPRKQGIKCNGAFCQRASALCCPHAKCLSHCIDEAGGCPIHVNETDNQQHPVVQQDWNWDYDQEDTDTLTRPMHPAQDTLTLPAEPYWDDDGVHMNDVLRALQCALQSAGTGQPAMFPSFDDILTAPTAPASSQQLAPTTQIPTPSQQSHHTFLVHKLSKPPCVTDQLDPMWAGDLSARAREEIESKRVSERRKEMERAARQHFILYWFDADNMPVSIQWAVHCLYFPQYRLSDDPALVDSLGTNIKKIDVYEESFMRWIPSILTHPFTLDSGCHIFIRRHGVTECSDFDELFKSSKLMTRPSHMRFNMKGERDSIRKKMKQRQTSIAASSSDVEILDNEILLTPKLALGKRRWAQSPSQEQGTRLAARVRLATSEDDFDARRATLLSPTPPLITSSSTSKDDSDAPPPLKTHQSAQAAPRIMPVHVPIYDCTKPQQVWPQGMYTVDMVVGFQQMDIPKLRSFYGQEQLFRLIFGDSPFVKATYHENCKAWGKTPLTILKTHKQSGRTQDGLWANCLASCHIALGLESKKHNRQK
ncbi:hypothetical protein EV702DRAFT_1052301 [Suillus placidus]|uniref:Uncharacterized protein n=1 Tax=Suillus placidus TaxID=48579 RepID=A0A9P6ZF20_9AGAM|nr:hypothetical protein EV702DRAFT_1052301 [Suillus placidus]